MKFLRIYGILIGYTVGRIGYIMNFKDIFKKWISFTSVYFTFCAFAYCAIFKVMNVSKGETLVPTSGIVLIFVFSALMGISQCVYSCFKFSKGLRVFIQYVVLLFASYFCLISRLGMRGATAIAGLFLISIIYFICFGIGSFFAWAFNRNVRREEAAYEAAQKKLNQGKKKKK